VGKTFTTCALLHAAKGQAAGYKPIISGYDGSGTTDTAEITRAGGKGKAEEISPWRFAAPLSPHMAAPREGRKLALDAVVKWTREKAGQPGLALIETVGGIMVPLNDKYTTLDWLKAAKLPLILVTGSYLGSISHTLTALEVIRQSGLELAALVVNESDGSSVKFDEARAGLSPFIGNIKLRIFQPRVSSWQQASAIHALLPQL
jgi:dethiobiotin synthetase